MRLQSLRAKLATANILPILLMMPFLSLYLLNTLEKFHTQKLLERLAQQGLLLFDQVQEEPALLEEPIAAQTFLTEVARYTDARVLLLSKTGTILGSTRAVDGDHIGTPFMAPAIQGALRGTPAQGTGLGLTGEVAYVVMPVPRSGVVRGLLRLSYEVDDVRAQFNELRWLVIGGTSVAAFLGLALGLGLATTITRPLYQLTEHIQALAVGNYNARVVTQRQDEIGVLAKSFNQMAIRLEDTEAKRQQQLAAIIHELARPLTGISAAVETLLDDADIGVEAKREFLAGIGEETARLERLVRTLQHVQKQILQPLQLQCAPVSLPRVISASIANFQPIAAQLGITLSAPIAADLPIICADEDRLIQVLTNLLDNALKFTTSGGTITVATGVEADAIWVCVTDTGTGIAPDELPQIFQQFYRGAESRPPEKLGMGLGLAICYEIITAHGGKLWAESTVNQGTRFTFTLPQT